MQLGDHESFFKYFRMFPTVFEKLLRLVAPLIVKSDQKRESITPAERLSVTLRYLATGDSHQTIAFSYRLGYSTVNKIVHKYALQYGTHYFLSMSSEPGSRKGADVLLSSLYF